MHTFLGISVRVMLQYSFWVEQDGPSKSLQYHYEKSDSFFSPRPSHIGTVLNYTCFIVFVCFDFLLLLWFDPGVCLVIWKILVSLDGPSRCTFGSHNPLL